MDHWGKGGFLSQEDSKHQEGSADGPFLTSQGEAASHSPWNLQPSRCQQIQCELWNWDVPNQLASSLIYKKPKNSCISKSYISHKALSAIFSCGGIVYYCNMNTGMMITVQTIGRLQKTFKGTPMTLTHSVCPVEVSLSDKPPLTSLHFHILKRQVVWLGKFFFSIMLLNWRPLTWQSQQECVRNKRGTTGQPSPWRFVGGK